MDAGELGLPERIAVGTRVTARPPHKTGRSNQARIDRNASTTTYEALTDPNEGGVSRPRSTHPQHSVRSRAFSLPEPDTGSHRARAGSCCIAKWVAHLARPSTPLEAATHILPPTFRRTFCPSVAN